MTTVVPLSAWAFEAVYESRIRIWISKALPILLQELKDLTPEDTKEMLWSYRVETVKSEKGNIVWTITNDADYAVYVEYWVWGITFWYHKPKWSLFYTWVGNMTFHRAVDNSRDRIIQIIYNEINS